MNAINIRTILVQARKKSLNSHSHSNKLSFNSLKKTGKLQTIQKIPSFKLQSAKKISQTIPVLQPNTKRYSRAVSVPHPAYGMNNHFLSMRKQSHLNSCFNSRKNKLSEITKQNRKIYVRINSQKSIYSSRELDKSYQQNRQIQGRLSQSKLSRRSNLSRNSSRHNERSRKVNLVESNRQYPQQIKASNINKAQSHDLDHFRVLFVKDVNKPPRPPIPARNQKKTIKKENLSSPNTCVQQKSKIKQVHPSLLGQNEPYGLLHKIAQEMFESQKDSTNKKSNAAFRSRKVFNY